jgi:dihydrofolate reductase
MRKVIVNEWMSLDGVVQAPGAADEDRSGGFKHGGWRLPYFDRVSQEQALKNIVEAGAFLLGRCTYEILASYWPNAPDEERVIAASLSTKAKYVASTTLTEPLECQNSKLLEGDIAEALAALKQEQGGDLHVIGSTELVQTLIEQGLVDEFRLMIAPLLLGGGKRIFGTDGILRPLRLVHSEVTTTGAILATYAPVNDDRPAAIG